jgi:alginate O-acetyltransferase complex protein AlgI
MKGAQPVRNPLHFAIFSFFYPRMAAGPIIRYQSIIPQIERMPVPNRDDVVFGMRRIIFGFIKKFLIADPVATLITTRYLTDAVLCGADVIYLCLLLYIRIYMDFSAYSDMAIGLARLWGIRVPENFSFPFVATSPSAFWRRWHISLSTWIRDYIYIPLGGAHGSQVHRALNLALAMALCGLWHGSAWHFVLWGIFHGVLLTVGHFVKQNIDEISSSRLVLQSPAIHLSITLTRNMLGWVITQTSVAFSWLLFFYPISDVELILRKLPIAPIVPAIF